MDRRGFLKLFSAGIAGIALTEAIPLGRVWSFPSAIIIPEIVAPELPFLTTEWISMETLRILKNNLKIAEYFNRDWDKDYDEKFLTGSPLSVRFPPQRLPD